MHPAGPEDEVLRKLVFKKIGLTVEEPEAAPLPHPSEITKMTHQQLKAMRATSTKMEAYRGFDINKALTEFYQSVIHFWFTFFHSLKPSTTNCTLTGHKCANCGTVIPVMPDKNAPKRRE